MHFRNLTFLAAAAGVVSLLPGPAIAQSLNAKPAKTATQTWTVPRTADGKPDLQGVWANNTATPLDRPEILAGSEFLTEQEVTALKAEGGRAVQRTEIQTPLLATVSSRACWRMSKERNRASRASTVAPATTARLDGPKGLG